LNTREQILGLLADGCWHSGEAMATALGISRAAVWKQIASLNGLGLELHAVRGRGYRLAAPVELLKESEIRSWLEGLPDTRVEVKLSLDSTNHYLMEIGPEARPAICFAEHQSAGRGRRGRSWYSPFGGNLYLSVSWRFSETPPGLGALGLAIGSGVARYLDRLGIAEVGLKWPNDIFWKARKLGGILIEHRGESGGSWHVVAGLGLNLRMQPADADSIEQPWVDFATIAATTGVDFPGRNALAGGLARAVVTVLQQFQHEGFAPFRDQWSHYDVTRDKNVRISQLGHDMRGVARGINHDGALRVESDGAWRSFISGDVSLRMEPDQ